jgi:large subunit ribosomal protein L15
MEKKIEQTVSIGLNNLVRPKGSHKRRKLLGRGPSSGHGKTSTRGSKGQTSRAGRDFYPGFEGGQTPLIRKFPKRGFINRYRKTYKLIKVGDLKKFKSEVTIDQLLSAGLIKNTKTPVKILGDGEIKTALTVHAHAFSVAAKEKIEKAGGKINVIKII